MSREKVRFTGATGDQLVGRISLPDGPVRSWALFAHCFTCSKDLHAARRIASALAERGIATLSFDFTGIGESRGDFADTNFSSNVGDLVAAAGWLRDNRAAPSLLVGHSLGGAAVLTAAPQVPESRAVATINAPSDTMHLLDLLHGVKEEVEAQGSARVRIAGRTFTVKRQFLEDAREQNLMRTVAALDRALLVLHAPGDEVVGIEHAERLYEAASQPKSAVSLHGADHLLTDPADARYAAEVIAAWASRYLPEPSPVSKATPHGEIEVRGGPAGLRQEVRAGPHNFVADEPKEVGGTDLGPSPYQLLLASLGSCINMTLRLYAGRKGWPLQGVQTVLRHERLREEGIEQIEAEIALEGVDLDEPQRRRLLEIAGRCPVHRTLHGDLRVSTRLV